MFSQIKKLIGFVIGFILIASNLAFTEGLQVFNDEYVVEINEDNSELQTQSQRTLNINKEKKNFERIGARLEKIISKKSRLLSKNGLNLRSLSKIKNFDINDTYCEELIASNLVTSCSPNFVIKTQAVSNDPSFEQLWGLSSTQGIRAPAAWDVTKGTGNVVVAVIDSGVDYNHPDLKANMWVNDSEISGNGIDDDDNGYIDDIHGISAITSSGDPMDQNGHGTHVAGTIGAKGNNAVGVVGVNWNVKIMALRFLDQNGSGSLSDAIEAINYMTEMKNKGVNIVVSNNSWGGIGFVQSLQNAIEASLNAGIIFVAAAGNSASDNDIAPSYPASYDLPGIVSVAAIDANQNLANFSNYGLLSVHLAAPGVNIYSTFPGNTYRSMSGTSMASPHVAGAIALLRAIDSTSSNSAIIDRLYETAEPLPSVTGVTYTGRKLNLERLIKNERTPFNAPTDGSATCQYTVNETTETPNLSADLNPIVLKADEYSFHTIDLPFDFPYYGTNLRKVIVSPNGVIYTKTQPAGNDYLNTFTAPQNAIAALHTDLTAEIDPNGVRVAVNANEAVIYWRVKHYQGRFQGDIHVRTVLKSTGEIQTFLVADDATSLTFAQTATIGIKGQTSSETTTYASKDASLITNNLGISYIPTCTTPTVTPPVPTSNVTGINAYAINAGGRYVKRVIPGSNLYFNFDGQGTGTFQLNIELGGLSCTGSKQVTITNGVGQLTTQTERFLKKYKSIKFEVGKASERLQIKRTVANKTKLRSTTNSPKQFRRIVQKDCQRLLGQL